MLAGLRSRFLSAQSIEKFRGISGEDLERCRLLEWIRTITAICIDDRSDTIVQDEGRGKDGRRQHVADTREQLDIVPSACCSHQQKNHAS